ncbi:uncharacterized protein LOC121737379 [Aricia agestis]|uniref:uncharacterized protein LOC121737379 n=1 Tax=Aricia agestis TaxID=91739 RepID=UPI001C20AB6E|nr:uncharacterized protein LOC121737379 [Aricia agestis]
MALVSNELLAFVQHVVNTMDEDGVVQLYRSTYTNEEICKGRLVLYEALGKTAQMTSRRRDGSERSLQDIISLLKQTNPAELPVFVAKQLHKLPAVSTDHVNVSSLLQKFNIMRAELDEMRVRLDASESTIIYILTNKQWRIQFSVPVSTLVSALMSMLVSMLVSTLVSTLPRSRTAPALSSD